MKQSYKALGYIELYDDVEKIINLNYSSNSIQESDDSGWSWNFLRRHKASKFKINLMVFLKILPLLIPLLIFLLPILVRTYLKSKLIKTK